MLKLNHIGYSEERFCESTEDLAHEYWKNSPIKAAYASIIIAQVLEGLFDTMELYLQ